MVGSYALENNTKLKKIVIPENLHDDNFLCYQLETCPNLLEIEVDEKNTYFKQVEHGLLGLSSYDSENYAVYLIAPAATSFTIPKNVERILSNAGIHSENLQEFIVEDGNTNFYSEGGVLFNYDKTKLIRVPENSVITNYVIPDTVEYIEEWAFGYCSNLESVTGGTNVKEIADLAFYGSAKLEEISLSTSLEIMGDSLFGHCESLTEITIPEGITSLGRDLFDYCENLVKLTIPASVTEINDGNIVPHSKNVVIYTPADSYAETYAEEYGINCVTY